MSTRKAKPEKGIEARTRAGGATSYRGHVWSARDQRRIRGPWFPAVAQARHWRLDTLAGLRAGTVRPPVATTLHEAAAEFIDGARDGRVLNRKGERYRPSVIRDYRGDLDRHVLPTLGDRRLSDVRRGDVQDLVDRLVGAGLAPSTVRNALDPLRRIFDRAVKRDVIAFSPCGHLELPRGTGTRDRIATPAEAAALLAALPTPDRAAWATMFYAGLRMGELRGLRARDVDLSADVIHVEQTWDDQEGAQEGTKSGRTIRRTVSLIGELRPILASHVMASGRRGADLLFGRTATVAEDRSTIRRRALAAWKRAGLAPIGPHECRHTFGSMLAAAGIDAGERQRQMGHASSAMMDRYTHGIDGSVAAAGERLCGRCPQAVRIPVAVTYERPLPLNFSNFQALKGTKGGHGGGLFHHETAPRGCAPAHARSSRSITSRPRAEVVAPGAQSAAERRLVVGGGVCRRPRISWIRYSWAMEGRDLIIAARRGAGLTQAELALRVGRRQPTISAWENATQRPSFEAVLEAVCACGQELAVGLPKADDSYDALIAGQLRMTATRRITSLTTLRAIDIPQVLADLAGAGGDFVVVGRVAAAAHGWPITLGAAEGRDLLVEVVPASLRALERAVARCGWASVAERRWRLHPAACLVAHEHPPRTSGYRDLSRGAELLQIARAPVRVASLIDLIRIAEGDAHSSLRPYVSALWSTLEIGRRPGRENDVARAVA